MNHSYILNIYNFITCLYKWEVMNESILHIKTYTRTCAHEKIIIHMFTHIHIQIPTHIDICMHTSYDQYKILDVHIRT